MKVSISSHLYIIFTRLYIYKIEVLSCFIKYMNLVKNQLDMKIKTLQTDRRREYLSDQFKELCDERGIEQQLTIFGTPQQNRVTERKNRKLIGQS